MSGVKGKSGGKREGSGRKKGVPNKLTADLKSAILGALEAKGGQKYLEGVAESNPQVFCALLGKVLPMTVVGDPAQPLTFKVVSGVPRDEPAEEAKPSGKSLNGFHAHN